VPLASILGPEGLPLYPYFLNFDANDGRTTAAGCIATLPNGNCTIPGAKVRSDGSDVLFGDLGNDWLVGGPGDDTLWGGWGNALMDADGDLAGCLLSGESTSPYDATGKCITPNSSLTWLNDTPDTHPTYEDRVFGGAGLDILIGNTGGDRLIDW